MARTGKTQLSQVRAARELSQEQMAEQTGISLRTYQRLESGRVDNPPLRYLTNCALVLDVELGDILEPRWLEWLPLSPAAAPPPKHGRRRATPHAPSAVPEPDRIWQQATRNFLSARRHLREHAPAKALPTIVAAQRAFQKGGARYAPALEALDEAVAAIGAGKGATMAADILRDIADTSKYKPR